MSMIVELTKAEIWKLILNTPALDTAAYSQYMKFEEWNSLEGEWVWDDKLYYESSEESLWFFYKRLKEDNTNYQELKWKSPQTE